MTYAAQTVIKNVQVNVLKDPTGTKWSATALVEALNWAQRVIAAVRWDATAASATAVLIEGAAQVLPATAQGLIEWHCNTSEGGHGDVVTQCKREDLDAIEPSWRSRTPAATIQHYLYEDRHPRRFDVYPPAVAGTMLAGVLSNYPLDVSAPSGDGLIYTTVSGNISLADEFAPALEELVAYRAYVKDAEYAANAALAKVHLDAAVNMVGEELRQMVAVTPSTGKDESK